MNIFLRGPRYLATFANDDEVCGHILASFINSLYKNGTFTSSSFLFTFILSLIVLIYIDNAKMVFMSEGGISVIVESFQLNDIRRKTFQLLTKLFRNLCKIYGKYLIIVYSTFVSHLFSFKTTTLIFNR
jgi:hypothetical protein